jgi:hypothetical protein
MDGVPEAQREGYLALVQQLQQLADIGLRGKADKTAGRRALQRMQIEGCRRHLQEVRNAPYPRKVGRTFQDQNR